MDTALPAPPAEPNRILSPEEAAERFADLGQRIKAAAFEMDRLTEQCPVDVVGLLGDLHQARMFGPGVGSELISFANRIRSTPACTA